MRVTRVNREISVRPLSLFLFLSFLFISSSRITKESGCFLFYSLKLQVVEHTLLLSDDATEGEGEISDGLLNIVLGRLHFNLGSFQGVPSTIEASLHLAKMSLHVIEPLPITKIGVDLILIKEVVTNSVWKSG